MTTSIPMPAVELVTIEKMHERQQGNDAVYRAVGILNSVCGLGLTITPVAFPDERD